MSAQTTLLRNEVEHIHKIYIVYKHIHEHIKKSFHFKTFLSTCGDIVPSQSLLTEMYTKKNLERGKRIFLFFFLKVDEDKDVLL